MKRFWNSDTLTTWLNLTVTAFSAIVLSALAVSHLHKADIVLWYCFFSTFTIILLFDMGFATTFTRHIAYHKNNIDRFALILETMRVIYKNLSIIAFVVILLFGTMIVYKPILHSSQIVESWFAWAIVIAGSIISIYSNRYVAYLRGVQKVALSQRIALLRALVTLFFSCLAILTSSNLLILAAAFYTPYLLTFFIYKYFYLVCTKRNQIKPVPLSSTLWNEIKPIAWRSGIGVLLSVGLVQATGLFYANVANAAQAGSYLLALHIIRYISIFSQAPFYSKIPFLAHLYANNKNKSVLKNYANKFMFRSYAAYGGGVFLVTLLAPTLLKMIGSHVAFISMDVWVVLFLATFLERFGAMHLQLYSLTDRIIWHITNGVTAIITILGVLLFYPYFHLAALPLGLLVGNACFYVWYPAYYSYKTFKLNFFRFEKKNIAINAVWVGATLWLLRHTV